MLREFIKKKLLSRGMIVSRPPGQFVLTRYKLESAKKRGLEVRFAIDGGAASGSWAEEIRGIYPQAKVLMVEPRQDCQAALAALKANHSGLEVRQTLLGRSEGEVEFYESADMSTALPGLAADAAKKVTKRVTTLDGLVKELNWGWPDLIKLDLQGYELEALAGASECLANAQAVLLEVSFIEFEEGMPLIAEVAAFMKQHGFVVYDIVSLWHRPLDGALAQGDFLFVRADHPLRASRRFFPET